MQRCNDLNVVASDLKTRVLKLQSDIDALIKEIDDSFGQPQSPEDEPEIMLQLMHLSTHEVQSIYADITQLMDGSYINGVGLSTRRNRNPVIFKSENDFLSYIENRIETSRAIFSAIHRSYTGDWSDWSYDPTDNEPKKNKPTKNEPVYEKFNGHRKYIHICKLFNNQNTENNQSNGTEKKVDKKESKKNKKRVIKLLNFDDFSILRKRKDHDSDDDNNFKLSIRRNN